MADPEGATVGETCELDVSVSREVAEVKVERFMSDLDFTDDPSNIEIRAGLKKNVVDIILAFKMSDVEADKFIAVLNEDMSMDLSSDLYLEMGEPDPVEQVFGIKTVLFGLWNGAVLLAKLVDNDKKQKTFFKLALIEKARGLLRREAISSFDAGLCELGDKVSN